MKKFLISAMALVLSALSLVSCTKKSGTAAGSNAVHVAMITDSGDITDQSFNQTTYTACAFFCGKNKLTFNYYKPSGNSTADRVASINAAIQDDYNVVVLPGFLFGEAIVQVAEQYPDVTFIGIDVSEFDIMSAAAAVGKNDWKIPANVFCAVYQEEIPGFMAGYAAVKEGYRHLGFLGGMAVPAVIRYGFGFVQGCDAAAKELGVADKVSVEYVYGGQFFGDQQIKAAMDSWYKNRGVEVVFACGGGIWTSAADAARDSNGKVIGVDVDQSEQINSYKDGMCLTSAMKGLGATVNTVLQAILDGNWAEYSGKIATLGLVSPTNLASNFVQLPTDTWTMKNFTVEDYQKLTSDIYNKKITVSSDVSKAPETAVTFHTYPNIK